MAKDFLLKIEDFEIRNSLQVSFGIKVTKTKVIDDITTFIFKNLTLKQCLFLKSLISDNDAIVTWINQTFQEGKNFMIMFTQNTWEIIIENNLPSITTIYHQESINNHIEFITSSNVQKDPSNYLIPPNLCKYLDFTNCFLRSNKETYIRAIESSLDHEIFKNILLMFSRFQDEIYKTDKFEDNFKRLNRWLLLCQNRYNKFNYITIHENFFCVYVC
jgi:hypothetical protein